MGSYAISTRVHGATHGPGYFVPVLRCALNVCSTHHVCCGTLLRFVLNVMLAEIFASS